MCIHFTMYNRDNVNQCPTNYDAEKYEVKWIREENKQVGNSLPENSAKGGKGVHSFNLEKTTLAGPGGYRAKAFEEKAFYWSTKKKIFFFMICMFLFQSILQWAFCFRPMTFPCS